MPSKLISNNGSESVPVSKLAQYSIEREVIHFRYLKILLTSCEDEISFSIWQSYQPIAKGGDSI